MAQSFSEKILASIEDLILGRSEPMAFGEIADALDANMPRRTLQYRLKHLVEEGRLARIGAGRWTKYTHPGSPIVEVHDSGDRNAEHGGEQLSIPLTDSARTTRAMIQRPLAERTPIGYELDFLDAYVPNETQWLSATELERVTQAGTPPGAPLPAGTFASRILDRLLIDLSWNSSRLEGNTYSLLDTRRLIQFGKAAQGKEHAETQMILNHKEAIRFLVQNPEDIGFDRRTVLSLHALLADNLLPDASVAGRLRQIPVGIEQSVFYPIELPQRIEACFDQMLATAASINNPFEQALFILVQLPYLQPFEDVNKRVSRLAANIPFVRGNLIPLSFQDVPRDLYVEALLGVYELNRVDLFKDIFVWAYERSAARYTVVRQTLGEPDPFIMQYREELRDAIGQVIRDCLDRRAASEFIDEWIHRNIEESDRDQFREVAENELLALHGGNFARYRIRPSEFDRWNARWNP